MAPTEAVNPTEAVDLWIYRLAEAALVESYRQRDELVAEIDLLRARVEQRDSVVFWQTRQLESERATIARLRRTLARAGRALAFVRSWSRHPALAQEADRPAPDRTLRDDFWAWAEGWDCELEPLIAATLNDAAHRPALAEARDAHPVGGGR